MSTMIIEKREISNEKNKNEIFLQGLVIEEPVFDHSIKEKKFYSFKMKIYRENNKSYDILLVYCGEEFLSYVKKGERLSLIGKIFTWVGFSENKAEKIIKVKMINLADFGRVDIDINQFVFEGYVIDKYPLRIISSSEHRVIDIKILNKYLSSKTIFVCNAWDKISDVVKDIELNSFIEGCGRLQKRDFIINKEDGTKDTKTIYEVCLNDLKVK